MASTAALCCGRFKDAIAAGALSSVETIKEVAVLAAVGERMAHKCGSAAQLFSALASDNINISRFVRGRQRMGLDVCCLPSRTSSWASPT